MAKNKKTDDHGWDVGGRRREEDPDIQFLRLKARKARPAKALLWAILVALLIVIYLLQNPVAQNVDIPAVDYNPAGKQAAYKLTEIWLKDNPLGKNAVITSWDGCKETTYKDGDKTIPVYRHDLTVESSLGWWTVHTTIRTDDNGLLGYPSASRKSLPNTATPNDNITWPGTLSDATASDALSRLLTQWGQAYVGHDADMLTTIVKDPDTRIKYRPLRLSDKAQATVDKGRYLNRGDVDKDENTSDRAVFRVNIELPEDQTATSTDPDLQSDADMDSDGSDRGATDSSTLSYDVVVADPDGSPSIVAWGGSRRRTESEGLPEQEGQAMRRITVFADGRTMEWTISTGQRVSFKRIVGDKVIEVPEGRILDENARTITAGYEYLGGLFRNRMLKGSAVILRPVIGKKDTYHVDKWVRGLGLGE